MFLHGAIVRDLALERVAAVHGRLDPRLRRREPLLCPGQRLVERLDLGRERRDGVIGCRHRAIFFLQR
ncbi:MAG: hypothetical protein DMD61_05215 [Gemmatimonadetes bacterium]|nr:MAG: hypothetical protein DMD67_01015 [Gemmatimonadota bacterium]PYP00156.1 MAG: hypothetical protein DMD61_05215 [Gemmatimonadota bacterium]